MSPLHAALLLLNYLGAGIIVPVLGLMLLARGCSLQTLPLMIGLFSLVSLCLEVPSGVFADWMGRKKTYLASIVLTFLGMGLLLYAHSLPLLALAVSLWGASRAFASGSLDALIIDACMEKKGSDVLAPVTAQLNVLISAGIALGALVGGLLPAWGDYSLHLLIRLVLLALLGILCAVFLRESPRSGGRVTLWAQLAGSAALLRGNRPFWLLILCMATLAGAQGLIEVYWQPALLSFLPGGGGLWLALLCVGGYLLETVCGLCSGRIPCAAGRNRWRGYFLLQALLGVGLLLLGRQNGIAGFAAAYLLFYAVIGVSNIQEQTLLNSLSDSNNRATVLSLASLTCQLGNMAFCAASSPVVEPLGFRGVWGLGGSILLLVCAISAFLFFRSKTAACSS